MSRRRVLFAAPSAYPVGGLATWLDLLMPDLEMHGWESWLAIPDGRWSDADAYLAAHPFSRVVRLRNPAGTWIGRLNAVGRALDRVRPEVVVVANLVDFARALAQRRVAGGATPRLVSSVHSLVAGPFADLDREELAIDFLAVPNRLAEAMAGRWTRLDPFRIRYAQCGVETLEARDLELAESGPTIQLVYPGRFDEEQKRILDLPRVLAALDRRGVAWSLDLAGAGPLEAELLSALRPFGERVRWHGALPPELARERLLRPGAVLILCSRWELGPLVAWEALARGVVVASTRFVGSGLEASLRHDETALLWEIGEIERAADEVARLSDPELRRRLLVAGWRQACERYARPVAAKAWSSVLDAVLEAPPRMPAASARPLASGRLERLVGLRAGDWLRRIARRPALTSGPGDEWPHSLGGRRDEDAFFAEAALLDREGRSR